MKRLLKEFKIQLIAERNMLRVKKKRFKERKDIKPLDDVTYI
jgi:hypothetical protein